MDEKVKAKIELQEIPTIKTRLPGILERLGAVFGGSFIPLTAVFEALGYSGVTGLWWGMVTGAIAAVAGECGYEVIKFGRSLALRKMSLQKQTKYPLKDTYITEV
jgi:hypothetical protein